MKNKIPTFKENFRESKTAKSFTYFCKDNSIQINRKLILDFFDELKIRGERGGRICLHTSPDSAFHEMIIIDHRENYYRPHKHLSKGESCHIIEGKLAFITFDDKGNIKSSTILGEGENYIYRIEENVWHTVFPLTDYAIYHESKPGPFLGEEDSLFSKWAPDGTNPSQAEEYKALLLQSLRKSLKSVLITGASGFIGQYLTECFAEKGMEVIAHYRTQKPNIFENQKNRIVWIQSDLREPLMDLPETDLIIHTAALAPGVEPWTTEEYIQSNIEGMKTVVDYANRTKPQLFINLSSIVLLGKIEVDEVSESTQMKNMDIYGVSKYFSELLLKECASQFPSISLRLPGIVGRGTTRPWLGQVLKKAISHQPIQYFNGQSYFNNLLDLPELQRLILHLSSKIWRGAEVVNVATDQAMQVDKLLERIIVKSGSKSKLEEVCTDQKTFSINIDKLKNQMGFSPVTTDIIVDRSVKDYLYHFNTR